MKMLLTFTVLSLAACAPGATRVTATETEQALCEAWETFLPTRSHLDTEQTQKEVGQIREAHKEICR